ncbi:hypothetical protein [Antribacter gilvus]|uniref:hypothetical protein n=1 Tax=Antribacter gilvus TaxID=2304675 RepID=UPI000F7B01B6|nr:hypothetical protein [Antribacter gilvus]
MSTRRRPMITWAGGLIAFYGAAHTVGALTVEGAAGHAGAWFGGELRGADLSEMSPANSAYWLSVDSFGPQLVLIGLLVLWIDGRGLTPPKFLPWALAAWVAVDAVILGWTPNGLIIVVPIVLLLIGAYRTRRPDKQSEPLVPAAEKVG